jgi:DNA-binding NtrC family response regulator
MATAIIVDVDNRATRWLQEILESEGIAVTISPSVEEFQRELGGRRPGYDLALLTIEASAPRELQLLTACRGAWPSVQIMLIVNGVLDASLASRATDLGAEDFLEKPFSRERVRECVRTLLSTYDPLERMLGRLREAKLGDRGERLLGESRAFLVMLRDVAKVVPNPDASVLITGETGTGKELIVRAIHDLGPRAGKPLVSVNIKSLPETLVESHLFGHEKGAFTTANERHQGYLEEARDGTLFLDEIGELDQALQIKLLRVTQEKVFRRLGGDKTLKFEARLICATNLDLARNAGSGKFRLDLFHRIATYPIHAPALRDREGDLDLLRQHFLERFGKGRRLRFAPETLTILRNHAYPGNIRELEHIIQSAVIGCLGDTILPRHLPLGTMRTFEPAGEEEPAGGRRTRPAAMERAALAAAAATGADLAAKLVSALPADWEGKTYEEVQPLVEQAFDRAFLWRKYERASFKVSRAAKDCGMAGKTFRPHWRKCGFPPLKADAE